MPIRTFSCACAAVTSAPPMAATSNPLRNIGRTLPLLCHKTAASAATSKLLIIYKYFRGLSISRDSGSEQTQMRRSANGLTRKCTEREKSGAQGSARELDLDALRQTPGFMIRILQLLNFEAFYRHFEALELSPVEYAILIIVRDNKTVTQSELAAVLKMHLPNLVKILSVMEVAGIMKRKRSARDKRAVELSLSASGQRRADEASRLGAIFDARTLAPLSKPEQTAFVQMLARLAEAY